MSHFLTVVLTQTGTEQEVGELLAPYDENGEWFADGSRWDWWVIGGRWTGWLDGYDPSEDPRNQEKCDLCAGTGVRPVREGGFSDEGEIPESIPAHLTAPVGEFDERGLDSLGRMPWPQVTHKWFADCLGCNSCKGKGTRVKWSYEPHSGDVGSVAQLREAIKRSYVPGHVVTPDGQWHEQSRAGWFGMSLPDENGYKGKDEAMRAAAVDAMLDQYPNAVVVAVDCHV